MYAKIDYNKTIGDLLEEYRWAANQEKIRARVPVLPIVHFGVVSAVAVLCLSLVR
ncbi:MAG TPA: hypothetical protein VIF38_00245 [Burkholderiales bacterium]|jgi:hypothetical protein